MAEITSAPLREHEAPDMNVTAPAGYSPSEEEKITLRLVYKLFDKAKAGRKKYDQHWLDRYKMFRGKQWKDQRPSYRHSEVINLIFQHLQSTIPLMTDSRPRINFIPQEPSDFPLSQILNKVGEADWEKYNWLMVLTEQMYDSHIYGTSLGDIQFDAKAEEGMGAVSYESLDPFYTFPDPEMRDLNDKRGKFFIVAEPMDLAVLKREYPQKAAYLKADLTDLLEEGDRSELENFKYVSPTNTSVTVEGGNPYEAGKKDRALKITCWIAPNAGLEKTEIVEEKKPVLDEQGQPLLDPVTGEAQVEYQQKLKYPNGRKICVSGGMVLEDGPNPYEDKKFPYTRLVNYIDPRSFWGISEVEQLEGPQRTFNKLVSFALDVLTLMGNPVWVVDTDSEVDTDNLVNRPGLIVEKAKGTEVRREEGVQLQPYVLQLIDRMKTWFDDVGGDQEVSRGVKPESVTAASAITALQDAAKTRVRQKTRNVDALLQQHGQLYLSRVFQFYSAPRVFRLTNDQSVSQYFKMHVQTVADEQGNPVLQDNGSPKRVLRLTSYNQDPESGQYAEDPTAQEYEIRGNFDVRVNMGSSLPFAKDEKISLAKFLAEAGAIDGFELLKAVDYPNAEAVYQQVQERKMQQAQAEAAMAPPQGPPPGQPAQPPAA